MPIFTHQTIESQEIECDVCIIGSGAGGSPLAAGLAQAGKNVVMLEAGSYHTQKDFDMDEAKALQTRYQEGGLRATDDLSISILQGYGVGGSTTINWTTCFRTPERILNLWAERHGVNGLSNNDLLPHFEATEKRLNIQEWPEKLINKNNAVLFRGAQKIGWEASTLRRNVLGCLNSGYCGMGCPTNAKQGMLLTYIPDAVKSGMRLFANVRATKLIQENNQITSVIARVWDPIKNRPNGQQITIHPKICVSACGAINGPALLLRSEINNNDLVGRRTFLHPVVGIASLFPEAIDGWYGAPQSVACHEFIDRGKDRIGFFIEAAPTHPILTATAASNFGLAQHGFMSKIYRTSFLIALQVDGVLEGDNGGRVTVMSNGRIKLSYPTSIPLQESFKASMKACAQLSFAAGAEEAHTLHSPPFKMISAKDIAQLDNMAYGSLKHGIFTAHQMGGLPMGNDPSNSVVNSQLQHHYINNLFVVDGSVFPTGLGVNPSQTIYALGHRAREHILNQL